MENYNKIKNDQLGMSHGKASNKLRKLILFSLLVKYKENFCFKCNKEIQKIEDLSIEHKIPWLHSEDPVKLFFDLENISFSHLSCNCADARINIEACRKGGQSRKGKDHHFYGKRYTTEEKKQHSEVMKEYYKLKK